jgi:hypothetical protein
VKSLPTRRKRNPALAGAALVWLAIPGGALAADDKLPDPSKLPPAADVKVDYARDIAPIIENTCLRCHGPQKPKSHFRLDSRAMAVKGGDDGGDVVPGDSSHSRLIFYVARLVDEKEMPPEGKGTPLTPAQVGLLRAWIDQGAAFAGASNAPPLKFSVDTTMRWASVSGNKAMFRQQTGISDGWGGGISSFSLEEKLTNDMTLRLQGRFMAPDQDYKLAMRIDKPDLGYVDAGFQQFREYYNDTGGYFQGEKPSHYSLNQDLFITEGKSWINLGLDRPNLPKMVLGYEYDYREGNKSLLEWGGFSFAAGGPTVNNIYPSVENVDEHTHVLTFDISHDLGFARVEDNFRAEFYRMDDRVADASYVLTGLSAPDKLVLYENKENHVQVGNAFKVEKDLYDGWLVSAGYYYSKLTGDAAFNQSASLTPLGAAMPGAGIGLSDAFWNAQDIVLDQQIHTANLNSFWGPWRGLSLATGVQAQWMDQSVYGSVQYNQGLPGTAFNPALPAPLRGDINQAQAEESAVLKYDAIPFTIVSAEARLLQESLRQTESEGGGPYTFGQNIDAGIETTEFRTGFSTSPWQAVSFGVDLKRRETVNNYGNPAFSGIGAYPGFVLEHDFTTDEAAAKLSIRPAGWVKVMLTYQVDSTDYDLQGQPYAGGISTGGLGQSGVYNAHVYGANVFLTPWRRVTLNGSFNYYDSRIRTAVEGLPAVAPYTGGTFLANGQAAYALNKRNDLKAGYTFSQSNFGQDNSAAGLPLGLDNTFHSVTAGIVHKLKGNKSISLEYGFYRYQEPTSGGENNYEAHMIFATFRMRWP